MIGNIMIVAYGIMMLAAMASGLVGRPFIALMMLAAMFSGLVAGPFIAMHLCRRLPGFYVGVWCGMPLTTVLGVYLAWIGVEVCFGGACGERGLGKLIGVPVALFHGTAIASFIGSMTSGFVGALLRWVVDSVHPMPRTLSNRHLPNREEFISFWKERTDRDVGCGTIIFGVAKLVAWLGGSYALALHLDPTSRYFVLSLIGAVAFFIVPPIVAGPLYWRRYDRFLRCPQCRDWIGSDLQGVGAYERLSRTPKWVTVSQTGCCPRCGAQMIALEQMSDTRDG